MPESEQYYRQREVAAREAAARATDPIAARVHLRLADEYAKVVESGADVRRLLDARQLPHIDSEDASAPPPSS